MKPLIGITAPVSNENKGAEEVIPVAVLNAQYARAVRDAGGVPVILPAHFHFETAPDEILDRLDGLLFSGGNSFSETSFLSQKAQTLRDTDPKRYDFEISLAREANRRNLPMMGICRGHQTLVEAFGGRVEAIETLQPAIEVEHRQAKPRVESAHGIETVDHTVLRSILGPRVRVNSLHRQVVSQVPHGFRAAAHSADGLIEAVVGEKVFVLGLQFHPEWLYDRCPEFLELFALLIEAAKGNQLKPGSGDR